MPLTDAALLHRILTTSLRIKVTDPLSVHSHAILDLGDIPSRLPGEKRNYVFVTYNEDRYRRSLSKRTRTDLLSII